MPSWGEPAGRKRLSSQKFAFVPPAKRASALAPAIAPGPVPPSADRSPARSHERRAPGRPARRPDGNEIRELLFSVVVQMQRQLQSAAQLLGRCDGPSELGRIVRIGKPQVGAQMVETERSQDFDLARRQIAAVARHTESDGRQTCRGPVPNLDSASARHWRRERGVPVGSIVTFCQTRSPVRMVLKPPRRGGYDCDLKEASVQLR